MSSVRWKALVTAERCPECDVRFGAEHQAGCVIGEDVLLAVRAEEDWSKTSEIARSAPAGRLAQGLVDRARRAVRSSR